MPDFIIRLNGTPPRYLILEIKGYDPLEAVKRAAAQRWVNAVNADSAYCQWQYAVAKKVAQIDGLIATALAIAPPTKFRKSHDIS